MSAIAGVMSFDNSKRIDGNIINNMVESVKHRGPDALGYFKSDKCCLGNASLNVIGDSPLPLSIEDNRYTITFDGAIYNYKDLKKELEKKGCYFLTQTDAEVILVGYKIWGDSVVARLNGIFSFAIWDAKKNSLFIARDYKGLIPMYFALNEENVVLSTEIIAIFASKLIDKKVNKNAIFEYLCRSHPPHPETMYEGIYKLMPGMWMLFEKDGSTKTEKYFSLEDSWHSYEGLPKNENELTSLLKEKLKIAVKKQLIGDVPIGMALSGGIDSNLIFKFMSDQYDSPLHAFTFTNTVKEIDESSRASLGCKSVGRDVRHYKMSSTYHDTKKLLDKSFGLLDAPDTLMRNFIQFMLLNQLAYDKKIKVLMAGYGADLLFLGLPRVRRWVDSGLLENTNINDWAEICYFGGGIDKVKKVELLTGKSQEVARESAVYKWVLDHKDIEPLRRIALFDQNFHSTTALGGANRATPIQIRSPFWDKDVSKLANAISGKYKINGSKMKYILREVASNVIPKEIIDAPKIPSSNDVMFWVNSQEFTSELRTLVFKNDSFSREYLDFEEVNKLVLEHQLKQNYSHLCWYLYALERWYRVSFLDE